MKLNLSILVCVTGLLLAGCGIKPGDVSAPPGAPEPDAFPHTYPSPATDPKP